MEANLGYISKMDGKQNLGGEGLNMTKCFPKNDHVIKQFDTKNKINLTELINPCNISKW